MIRIEHKQDCCGCTACVQVCPKRCISLKEDEEGFFYPLVDVTHCIDCDLCVKTCPVIQHKDIRISSKNKSVFAAINKSQEIRLGSSSGGIFSLIAEKVLDEGGVVFGAHFNEQWEVCHCYIESKDRLFELRGSKYVQSIIGDNYVKAKDFLKSGRKVLFSGTPCQIAGLYKFLGKQYENLITVDFVCHGVPSPGIWRKYLEDEFGDSARRAAGRNTVLPISIKSVPVITDIEFRDKKMHGWKKFSFVVRGSASKADKNSVLLSEMHNDNKYMKGFLRNIFLRPSCYHCTFKSFKSNSDITLADFWGVEKFYPEMNDDKGVSLVFTSNPLIREWLEDAAITKEILFQQAIDQNPAIAKSAKRRKNRRLFFYDLKKGRDLRKSIEKRSKWDLWESIRLAAICVLEKLNLLEFTKRFIK